MSKFLDLKFDSWRYITIKFNQYRNLEISKEYLLNDGYHSLYRNEDFEMDDSVIAMFDVSKYRIKDVQTIILHELHGVIIEARTTKQLMNEIYRINGLGFFMSKSLAKIFRVTRYIPFTHAYLVYMPVNGNSRQNTDWIAPHLVKRAEVIDKILHVVTVGGDYFQVDFTKGNFEKRMHDVSLLNESSFLLMEALIKIGNCNVTKPQELGLFRTYEKCECDKHLEMRTKSQDINFMVLAMTEHLLLNLGIEMIEKIELVKYYSHHLARLKRIY
ncbi:hypothetical protein IV63_GL001130 [Companilactobacillus crustorum]|uniref:Uncharacterized protein n=3 Tax=Companilactobacillus TaxID=2767879 RepID=A0A837RGE4_9LACO|nr:hypothetical protein FD26_GL000995 [Companilactobacillus crustorum JCM 15951]KRO19802.1 hypothetical protein IV63_GL001130 [Companilactobacillus crustorum]